MRIWFYLQGGWLLSSVLGGWETALMGDKCVSWDKRLRIERKLGSWTKFWGTLKFSASRVSFFFKDQIWAAWSSVQLTLFFLSFLGYYGFFHSRNAFPTQRTGGHFQGLKTKWPFPIPLFGGFVTGLSFCPPFLLAFTGAADAGNLGGSLLFFLAFFLGTSILTKKMILKSTWTHKLETLLW